MAKDNVIDFPGTKIKDIPVSYVLDNLPKDIKRIFVMVETSDGEYYSALNTQDEVFLEDTHTQLSFLMDFDLEYF